MAFRSTWCLPFYIKRGKCLYQLHLEGIAQDIESCGLTHKIKNKVISTWSLNKYNSFRIQFSQGNKEKAYLELSSHLPSCKDIYFLKKNSYFGFSMPQHFLCFLIADNSGLWGNSWIKKNTTFFPYYRIFLSLCKTMPVSAASIYITKGLINTGVGNSFRFLRDF